MNDTTNDELFHRYAALWAKVDAAKDTPTETWADHIDPSPIRHTNNRLDILARVR